MSCLEEKLNLAPGIISDNYDLGHLIQLVMSDTLEKSSSDFFDFYQRIKKSVFDPQEEFRHHKNLLFFEETANELKDTTVKNRIYQLTRWVRADLEGFLAFLRNGGTFYHIYETRLHQAKLDKNREIEEETSEKLSILTDAEYIIATVGLWQILGLVSHLSIKVQSSSLFPTSALAAAKSIVDEIGRLGKYISCKIIE